MRSELSIYLRENSVLLLTPLGFIVIAIVLILIM